MEKQLTPFTPEQVKEYIRNHGTTCPNCGGIPTAHGEFELDPFIPGIIQSVTCFKCQTRWTDVFTLHTAICRTEPDPSPQEYGDQFEFLDTFEEDEDRYTWGYLKE